MSRLILHRAIGSPPARAVMMLGDILAIKFDIRDINIIKMEHKSPAFLKLNPMGTVPVLQDGDFVLSESNAIMKYILSKYGDDNKERLYPSDLQTRAIIDQCLFFNAGVFFVALRNVGLETLLSGLAEPSDRHRAQIEASYRVVEAYLARTRHVAADSLTLADLSLGATATAIQCMHPIDNNLFPKCAGWMARLEEETFFKTINREGADFFGKMFNALWKKNKMKNQLE